MASSKNLTMKLLIDTNSHKVLFAEAGKDVVDFLFSLLGLPVGAIIKLLTMGRMVGSTASLYKSLEAMDDTYLSAKQRKASLLDPGVVKSASLADCSLLLPPPPLPKNTSYYSCGATDYCACGSYYTEVSGTRCPNCGCQMTTSMQCVGPTAAVVTVNAGEGGEAGYVKGVVTYTVMDDLTVAPMSTISSITMLNKFHVKDVSALKEKTVTLDFEKGLEVLRMSLQSKTVLTDVFLAGAKKE